MTKTKSGFLKAGAILGIIWAGFFAIFGMTLFTIQGELSHKYIIEDIMEYKKTEYDTINNFDGSITYKLTKDGETRTIESEKLDEIIELSKKVLTVGGIYVLAFSVASLALSILVLVNSEKEKANKGLIISLLCVSVFSANILTLAFMIVALCLKDKKVEEVK